MGTLSFLLASLGALVASAALQRPNIILILTDDQDKATFNEARFLPKINEYLVDQGVYYENFFAPVSVCCPSRVSLLRAQYAHNHNITFVNPPWGGWSTFNKYGYVGHTLPDFLQEVGYNTYYTGKLMNDHTEENCESLPVSGFNSSDILVDPYTYDYWKPGFSRDNGAAKVHDGEYSTDLVKAKALDYLETALHENRPFFVGIAPIACHSWMTHADGGKIQADIPAAHPRHARLFPTEQLPRSESFNPDKPSGVSWVRKLPKLNQTQEAYLDDFYRGRLRSLQAVDEIVEEVIQKLEAAGQLDNTYIFYTADNGFAMGTHRRQPGKTLGFEEDIHVPLVVRGPGIPKGYVDSLSSYGIVDLSRTILDIAGARTGYVDDGSRINLHQESLVEHQLARHSISEYWVYGVEEGVYGAYRTLRVHDELDGHNLTFSYSVWCTGERELYDLTTDPNQVRNILAPLNELGSFTPFDQTSPSGQSVLPVHLQKLLNRLDGLVLVLKTCVGGGCTNPYGQLFPSIASAGGAISRLGHALDRRFDDYFARLPKVQFHHCALGYQSRLEKPEWRTEWGYVDADVVFQGF
ncbi:hypothetical protein P7C73_g1707, partial [Tremellales sp. Uapishka_1]